MSDQPYPRTEQGNVQRFVDQFGHEFRYDRVGKRWLKWDGQRWAKDQTGAVYQAVATACDNILDEEVRNAPSDSEKNAWYSHWRQSQSWRGIDNAVKLAATHPKLVVLPEALDRQKWALNVENGVLLLHRNHQVDGQVQLLAHDPGLLLTRLAPVEYDPTARCPRFLRFLVEIFDHKREVIRYVQRALGYCLTGDTREQCFFMPYGLGMNGKSTLLNVVRGILGDYAMSTPATTFTSADRSDHGPRNDLARLKGARVVTAIELEHGKKLAESLVKTVTGRDAIAARFLFGEYFEYQPEFKLWLATNAKPKVRGTELAMWRRIHLIPFHHTIKPEDCVANMEEVLLHEASGILNWMIEGCYAWQDEGLNPPQSVKQATEEYRHEQDVLYGFLEECCTIAPNASCETRNLYEAYHDWANEHGEEPLSERKFTEYLTERGYGQGKDKVTRRSLRTGLALRDGVPADAPPF
jgi:putative DNA primase/helicase